MPEALANKVPDPKQCAAFLVKDRRIVYANSAADRKFFYAGAEVMYMIGEGREAYEAYQGGTLTVGLSANGIRYTADVTTEGEYHLFCIRSIYDHPELKGMALAGAQLTRYLQSSLSAASLLSKTLPDDPTSAEGELMIQLNQSLYQMLRAIRNMTDAATFYNARGEALKLKDLTAIIDPIGQKVAGNAHLYERNIRFTGIGHPVSTFVDADSMARAFYNMISNALQYSPEGSTVTIKASEANGQVLLTVQNQIIPEIFDPAHFQDLCLREPGPDNCRHGIGLGMTVIRSVAKQHYGTVLLSTHENQVTVAMSFPVMEKPKPYLRSPDFYHIVYDGGFDKHLVELSDILPEELYDKA